ncbi:hypothetical protein ACYCS5_26930 [Paenibacillus sp. SEL3]
MTETKKSLPKKEAEEVKKSCFIVMPISDAEGYEKGHFGRVYEHIIKPACELAGFEPIRADDVKHTNAIILDIIKKIIEADMVLCDLSSRNPNVLYELGIRHAFNLPVVLIKDKITPRPFDISALRDVEYDSTLRIDTVNLAIASVGEALRETYEQKGKDTNSLISLLSVRAAKLPEPQSISPDTSILLNAIENLNFNLSSQNKTLVLKKEDAYREMFVRNRDRLSKQIYPGAKVLSRKRGNGVIVEMDFENGDILVEHGDYTSSYRYPYNELILLADDEKNNIS